MKRIQKCHLWAAQLLYKINLNRTSNYKLKINLKGLGHL